MGGPAKHRGLKVVCLVVLVSCGGPLTQTIPPGFVNQTPHSDTELWAIWHAAQQSIAQQVDLNPLQREFHSAPPDLRPGDPRALQEQPHQLRVAAQPDVAAGTLYTVTGVQRADPTGLIACPQPCNVKYAAAYSLYKHPVTEYASSWDLQPDQFGVILRYEFENQILYELGYDMKWR
jgi:hypothetical protein